MSTPVGEDEIEVGWFVRDKKTSNDKLAVVVERHDKAACDYLIDEIGKTVAEYNPEYPDEVPVVSVAYVDKLSVITQWQFKNPEELQNKIGEYSIKTYTFPEMRLEAVKPALCPIQTNEAGHLYSHRMLITGVNKGLVFGRDYQAMNHEFGTTRDVCFENEDRWEISEDDIVSIEYMAEREDIECLPTILCQVTSVRNVMKDIDWAYLISI